MREDKLVEALIPEETSGKEGARRDCCVEGSWPVVLSKEREKLNKGIKEDM